MLSRFKLFRANRNNCDFFEFLSISIPSQPLHWLTLLIQICSSIPSLLPDDFCLSYRYHTIVPIPTSRYHSFLLKKWRKSHYCEDLIAYYRTTVCTLLCYTLCVRQVRHWTMYSFIFYHSDSEAIEKLKWINSVFVVTTSFGWKSFVRNRVFAAVSLSRVRA